MALRVAIIKFSLVLNAVLVLYLCMNWLSGIPTQQVLSQNNQNPAENIIGSRKTFAEDSAIGNSVSSIEPAPFLAPIEQANERHNSNESPVEEPPREVQESQGVTELLSTATLENEVPDPPLNSLERKIYPNLRDCGVKDAPTYYSQRGDYWIMPNYIPAAMSFRCDESITYTTHSEYSYLDNLDPLTSRWQGPVSLSVYAPGSDLQQAILTILHLRECWGEGIKKYVTFHLIIHSAHITSDVPTTEDILAMKVDCSQEPPRWTNVTTYRQKKGLLYPINIARNAARTLAPTYFVLPSDIELYPSINFIPEFMAMLKKPDVSNTSLPRVFVFSIFEVKENVNPPETKQELIAMLNRSEAFPFHKSVCPKCHNVPKASEWTSERINPGLAVFHIGKRKYPHQNWEPVYVGTNNEPIYDERLFWEGKSDKMTQMYILCIRDYEFHILNNAFLVHRPGIKKSVKDPTREKIVLNQRKKINTKIKPEYKSMYGSRSGCYI